VLCNNTDVSKLSLFDHFDDANVMTCVVDFHKVLFTLNLYVQTSADEKTDNQKCNKW